MADPIVSDTERYRTTEEEMRQAQINLTTANPGAEHIGDFYNKLATRLGTHPIVPEDFVMAVLFLVEDLKSGKDGYSDLPMTGKCAGLPHMFYRLLLQTTPAIADVAFPGPFAEACRRAFVELNKP